jgi:hypothetical protein
MSATTLSGPSVVAGPLIGNQAGAYPQEYSAEFGPSLEYNADGILDLRFVVLKDSLVQTPAQAHLNNPMLLGVDAVPSAQVTIAPAANVTNGTAMTLTTTASWGLSTNIPMIAMATGSVVTPPLMLDFGFSYLSVTSGSAVATVANGTIGWYQLGMWLVIGQAATATTPLIAQVIAVTPTTATAGNGTITLSANATYTNATAPVGAANIGTVYQQGTPQAHMPTLVAGVGRFWDPQQCLTRGWCVTGVSGGTGGAFKLTGYDIYGNVQTETITATAGAATTYGNKAFKAITSVVPQFTDAHNYTILTSDVIGFLIRSDRYELSDLYYNGSYTVTAVSTTSAWTACDLTNPATSTTKDPRGTFQVSARGPNATVTSTTYCNGTAANSIPGGAGYRVAMYTTISMYNLFNASPSNPVPFYGVTPA